MTLLRFQAPWPSVLPPPSGELPALDPAALTLQAPDLHLAEEGGKGRLSLWWTSVPDWPGQRLGVLGHFAAADADTAKTLLDAGCGELARQGCTLAVGPMDGNTWRSYRFMTDDGAFPRFALEPWNSLDWPRWWEATGFAPFQTYQSALEARMASEDPRLPELEARMAAAGVTLRMLDLADFEGELARIFEISETAFAANVLYTPLPKDEFLAMYEKVRPYAKPPLVWIAEQGTRPVGFVFCVPDLLQAQRGEKVDTLIVKTLAKVPDKALAGLGKLLLARVQQEAQALGFTRAIHALMHDANRSATMGEDAKVIRRYTLYSKALA
ncbi:MAG: N-acetyltransferase [Holophagaceae bacterium]|nr:N-acetyltransferase [Holophagaceae bacterium]